MERSMHRRQALVANLEPPGLADPSQTTFHHVADLPQTAAVRRSHPRQMVLDPPPLQPFLIARGPVLSIAVQGLRPALPTASGLSGRWHIVQQRQCHHRVIPLRPGDAHSQRCSVAINEQVPFCPFFASIRGVFAGESAAKNRAVALAVHAGLFSVDEILAAQAVQHRMKQFLPDASTLPVAQAAPASDAGATTHLQGKHLPGNATAQDENDACQTSAVIDGWATALARLDAVAGKQGTDGFP